MEQIFRILRRLTLQQKFTIAAVAVGVIGGLAMFLRWNNERDFAPLFTSLSAEDAAAVVSRIKESSTEYRLSPDGTAIKVPSAKVPDLRLQMAAAGLRKSGRIGFELFDKTNFGVTEFAEKINFHRALEGELERSVNALAEVENSRVHITLGKESIFLEERQPAKASVLVKLRPGRQLLPSNVQAVSHLLASAVDGLAPDRVSVLDASGRLLNRPRRQEASGEDEGSESALEYRRSLERDLLAKIGSTLDPLLGPDSFRAAVSIECDFTSGEQSEESFDPTRSVMTTSQRTEDVSGATLPGGVPGTASNLPRPAPRPAAGGQGVTRRTENIAYQTSRTVRRIKLPQGTVKRMSVSVLLDHAVRFEGEANKRKRIVEPLPAERVKTTRDLIAGVVGLQPERGDQLIVETLPFESTIRWEPPSGGSPAPAPSSEHSLPGWLKPVLEANKLIIAAVAAGAIALFAMAAFVIRRRRKRSKPRATVVSDGPAELSAGEEPEETESLDQKLQKQLAAQNAARKKEEEEILRSLRLPASNSKKGEVLAKHLIDESKKSPKVLAQVVRTWMNEADQ
jgi:flagellar M-ring protein FliF